MVDNLVEKVDECLLNRGRCVLFAYNWDHKNCPLYGVTVVGCLLFRGCLSIKKDSRDFQNCLLYHGCPLFRDVQ